MARLGSTVEDAFSGQGLVRLAPMKFAWGVQTMPARAHTRSDSQAAGGSTLSFPKPI